MNGPETRRAASASPQSPQDRCLRRADLATALLTYRRRSPRCSRPACARLGNALLRLAASIAIALAACAQVRSIGREEEEKPAAERTAGRNEGRGAATSGAPPQGEGQPAEHGRPPLPASPNSLLTDSAARQLKEALQDRGLLEKPSPGPTLDAATSDAVRQFQEQEGLAATGFPDQETLRRLNIDVAAAYRSAPEETDR